eukprot:29710_1
MWFICVFSIVISLVISSNQTAQNSYTSIHCISNTTCNVECSEPRSCIAVYCNNSTHCHVSCNGRESCYAARIYHSSFNQDIQIHCLNQHSCDYLQLQHDPTRDVIVTNHMSLTFSALAPLSASSVSLSDITTFSDIQITCHSDFSCHSMQIAIDNANISAPTLHPSSLHINISCNGIASCQHLKLYSTRTPIESITWDEFVISVVCNGSQSCMYAAIDAQKLRINALPSSASFADLYVYCQSDDSACLYMNIICPELLPFHANYDYLYQEKKCHLIMRNSYQNQIRIVSHHGMKMVDVQCDDEDASVCDGITLHCTEDPNEYFCSMQYVSTVNESRWYCDPFDISYIFNADYNYSSGCDEYLWYDHVAIIETSQIPQYDPLTSMRCSKYNPLLALDACSIYCDADLSCHNDIHCDNSTLCDIQCTGMNSCRNLDDWQIHVHCPSPFVTQSACSVTLNPLVPISEYGHFYVNYKVHVYRETVLHLTTSHNLSVYLYDYGMKHAIFEVLNISDQPTNWTDKYDVKSWFRIISFNDTVTTPVSIQILCGRCYTDWFEIVDYHHETRNVSVDLSCTECAGTEFEFWDIASFSFDCYQNCSYAKIQFTDTNANLNCYDEFACNGVQFITNPFDYSHYIDHKYTYNLNLFNTSLNMDLYSLYGFDSLDVNCEYNTDAICDADILDMHFHCGAPDYFHLYHSYDAVNESQCLQFNPLYSSAVISMHEFEYASETIVSEIIYCQVYFSCRAANIICEGDNCVLHCNGIYSCYKVTVHANRTQSSLTIYCRDYRACRQMTIYGNDVDYLEINCMAGSTCDSSTIFYAKALQPSKGFNLTCYDISTVQSVLSADDVYYRPSCKRMTIFCPQAPGRCHINLVNGLYLNPYGIHIYFARGFSELDLQCFYNPLNNQSTCHDVDYHCKISDSSDVYNRSLYQYETTFNDYTGECNGSCCDFIYSHSPTNAPSNAPTIVPSPAPTFSPSYSPTAAPTRYPTSFGFDAYFSAKFYIKMHDISPKLESLTTEEQLNDISRALEYSYLPASAGWSYSEYLINITNFTFVWNENKLNLTVQMHSDAQVVSHYVQFTQDNELFKPSVADQLQMAWNVSNLTFGFYADSFEMHVQDTETEDNLSGTDYTTIVFISFTSFIWLIAILSFLHSKNVLKCLNKLPKIQACDDQQYMNIISFGMQILDVFSDVSFAFEMHSFSNRISHQDEADLTVIRALYSFSFIFCFVPYIINLWFALKFQQMIDHPLFNRNKNKERLSTFTRNYFFKFSRVVAIFAIISGSVSSTLQLVNSHLFGHEWFVAGFSRYRLSKMRKFRILFNILLENSPQFCIQMIYFGYFRGRYGESVVSFTFIVSTCSSVISILSCIMAYCLQREWKPEFQTRFNIEITLIKTNDGCTAVLERTKSTKSVKIIPKHVKQLHKQGNIRKSVKDNVAKCIGRLTDNFELLYCIQRIDGLTVNGLCSSDAHKELSKLFQDHQVKLQHTIIQIYGLDDNHSLNKRWNVNFIVFDYKGRSKGFDGVECGELDRDHQSIRVTQTEGMETFVE